MDTRAAVDEIAADIIADTPEIRRRLDKQKSRCRRQSISLDTDEAAALLGVWPRCVQDWRLKGRGPRYVCMGARCVRYRPRELARFIVEREVASTSASVGGGDACRT